MTIRLILALILAFLVSTVFGKYYIPWLRKQKAGQQILEIGPNWHMSKQGTPTMGGAMFIAAVAFVCLTVGFERMLRGDWGHIVMFLFALIFGIIGFLDDWEKLKKKQNLGLTAKQKFALQLVAAVIFIFFLRRMGYCQPHLYIPFWNVTVNMPEWLYYIFAVFVIVGTVNSVNLTDGIDGLAASTSIPVCLFFVAVTFLSHQYLSLGIFASALLGGLLGFLVYNWNPAKVFMGDTGSLFLGGAIAAMAFAYDMPLILILIGIMFIIETMSDILQVGYFKLTHGKRIFKMAPFHHHLEMGGFAGHKWKEKELVALYVCITVLMCILAFIGVFGRYAI